MNSLNKPQFCDACGGQIDRSGKSFCTICGHKLADSINPIPNNPGPKPMTITTGSLADAPLFVEPITGRPKSGILNTTDSDEDAHVERKDSFRPVVMPEQPSQFTNPVPSSGFSGGTTTLQAAVSRGTTVLGDVSYTPIVQKLPKKESPSTQPAVPKTTKQASPPVVNEPSPKVDIVGDANQAYSIPQARGGHALLLTAPDGYVIRIPLTAVGSRVLVGRSEAQAHYQIPDSFCSRVHFSVHLNDDGSIALKDEESANGTVVNGQKITGTICIATGDSIRVGKTNLVVKIESL